MLLKLPTLVQPTTQVKEAIASRKRQKNLDGFMSQFKMIFFGILKRKL
jgi:hypothetical protein